MMEMGGVVMDAEQRLLFRRQVIAAERLAEAQEKLLQMAGEESDAVSAPAPPFCPLCGKVNPTVKAIMDEEGFGLLAEFILQAQCLHCKKVFFGFPLTWLTSESLDDIREQLTIKQAVEGGNE